MNRGGLARAAPAAVEGRRCSLDLARDALPGHREATGTGTLTESRLFAGRLVRGPDRRSPQLLAETLSLAADTPSDDGLRHRTPRVARRRPGPAGLSRVT